MCALYAPRMVGASYEEIVRLALGPRWFSFCLATIIVGGIGALTGYLLILASLLHEVMWTACPGCGFASSRTAIVLVLCLFVIFPISFCRNLHDLSFSTILSFATVVSVMLAVMWRGCEDLHDAGRDGQPLTEAQAYVQSDDGLYVNLRPHFFLGWPIILFSLGCHLQLPLVYLELPPATRAKQMTGTVIPLMTVLVVMLYLVRCCVWRGR